MTPNPRRALVLCSVAIGACSTAPPEFGPAAVAVVGIVRRDGQPVPGVAVRVYGFIGACREPTVTAPPLVTDQDGHYRYQNFSGYSPGTVFCGLGRAFFDRNGEPDSVSVTDVPIIVSGLSAIGLALDSARIDFALP